MDVYLIHDYAEDRWDVVSYVLSYSWLLICSATCIRIYINADLTIPLSLGIWCVLAFHTDGVSEWVSEWVSETLLGRNVFCVFSRIQYMHFDCWRCKLIIINLQTFTKIRFSTFLSFISLVLLCMGHHHKSAVLKSRSTDALADNMHQGNLRNSRDQCNLDIVTLFWIIRWKFVTKTPCFVNTCKRWEVICRRHDVIVAIAATRRSACNRVN